MTDPNDNVITVIRKGYTIDIQDGNSESAIVYADIWVGNQIYDIVVRPNGDLICEGINVSEQVKKMNENLGA
jgi:hypothetical protein